MLEVPGQQLPVSGPPDGTPALLAVIPAAKRTYAEAVATPALEGATHIYVQQGGCGTAAGGQLCGPLLGAGEGPQVLQASAGGEDRGGEQGPAEAPRRASATCGPLSLHAGGGPPGEPQDLPDSRGLRRSLGSLV